MNYKAKLIILILVYFMIDNSLAYAHRDDYIDETLVYLTLEKNEFEGEYWLDYGWNSKNDLDFYRHNLAFEWGITDKWMVDGRTTIRSNEDEGTDFDSTRFETRYRFYDEGDLPVDVAVSLESNAEKEDDGSTTFGLEPRLILSKDIGEKLNLTGNFSEEFPLNSDSPSFLVSFGTRYNFSQLMRIGAEYHYDIDNSSGSVIPQIWFALPHELTLKLGYSAGIDKEHEDFVRVAFELEF